MMDAASLAGTIKDTMMTEQGKIKFFSPEKNFGFIVCDDGDDLFFSGVALDLAAIDDVQIGDRIEFVRETSQDGRRALGTCALWRRRADERRRYARPAVRKPAWSNAYDAGCGAWNNRDRLGPRHYRYACTRPNFVAASRPWYLAKRAVYPASGAAADGGRPREPGTYRRMTNDTETPASTIANLQRKLTDGPALTQEERARGYELVCVLGSMLAADEVHGCATGIEAELRILRRRRDSGSVGSFGLNVLAVHGMDRI